MPVDLGKVNAKVELYDAIPGVELDTKRLRKSYTFVVDFVDEKPEFDYYGVTDINVPGPGGSVAACIIPQPLYTPIDNHLQTDITSPTSETSDIFWKSVKSLIKNEENEKFYYDLEKVGSKTFFDIVSNGDQLAKYIEEDEGAEWTEDEIPVKGDNVEEIDEAYFSYPIKYRGTVTDNVFSVFQEAIENYLKNDGNISASEVDEVKAKSDTTNTRTAITQTKTTASVWWAIKTAREFKGIGWPFWLDVRNHSVNVRSKLDGKKNTLSHSVICIKIRDGKTSKGANSASGTRSHLGDVELVIESTGKAYVSYEVKTVAEKSDNTSSSEKSSSEESSGSNPSSSTTSSWKVQNINLPSLFEMFNSGSSVRVGFMSVLGRLVIYDPSGNYAVASFSAGEEEESLLGFNLDTNNILVCGYGCSVTLSLSRMTFPKRGYYVLKDMRENTSGYLLPENEDGDLKPGDLCDGTIIGRPITKEMFEKNRGKSKKNKDGTKTKTSSKQYGATFKEYQESLYTPGINVLGIVNFDYQGKLGTIDQERAENTKRSMNGVNNFMTGMYNMWGKIHLVRHETPIPSIKGDKKFWFVYFETEDLKMNARDAEDKAIEDDEILSRSGFPTFMTIVAKEEPEEQTETVLKRDLVFDITPDVVSISVSHDLDSPRPTLVESKATVKVFDRLGAYQSSLAKARGIKIWLKWDLQDVSTYTDEDLVFSGIAFGRARDQAPGEEYVTFECVDHWAVLQGMQIKNSLFYDGFEVGTVVEDLCKKGGISFIDDVDRSQAGKGGPYYNWLGQGTSITKPKYRFSSEKSLKDCIMETIKNFEVYVRFDKEGILHYLPVPGGFLWEEKNDLWNPSPKETYYTDMDSISNYYQLITDSISINSTLSSSIYNSFMLVSVNRDTGALVVSSDSIVESLTDPSHVGYLGFIKEMRQQRPDLGGVEPAMSNYLALMLKKYGTPGFEVQFQTPGHVPSFYPGEFINLKKDTVDNGVADIFSKRFRVTKISHLYEASTNRWTTDIGAYQIESGNFDPSQEIN
jgi:hypothetical protein